MLIEEKILPPEAKTKQRELDSFGPQYKELPGCTDDVAGRPSRRFRCPGDFAFATGQKQHLPREPNSQQWPPYRTCTVTAAAIPARSGQVRSVAVFARKVAGSTANSV
uniref:Uncharacterized protein n=1 Tax=Oryza nivara TaxID=4536 RepID=A0A0E0IML7_ORYNI